MAKGQKQVIPKRGEIYLVNFDPTVGFEIKKTRPALVLQNDIGNRYSDIVIVAAITSSVDEKLYPTEVLLTAKKTGLKSDSVVLLNQIRSIDKVRLTRRIGKVDRSSMENVDRAIEISLGLIEV
jgi:mRNA interferase MazF